jgi:hypothetical protein
MSNFCLVGVQYGEAVKIGPWGVTARTVADDAEDEMLKRRAIESWEAFMGGDITYYLTVPVDESVARPLVFVSGFAKQSRPIAWKSTDMKIQSTLPLLGNDKESVQLLAHGAMTTVVQVRLQVNRN